MEIQISSVRSIKRTAMPNPNPTVQNVSNQSWYGSKKVEKTSTKDVQDIKQIGRIQVIPLVSIDDSDETETITQPSQFTNNPQQPLQSTIWNSKPLYQSTTVNTPNSHIRHFNSTNQSPKSFLNTHKPTKLIKSFSQSSQFTKNVQHSLTLPKDLPALTPSLPQSQPPRPLKPPAILKPSLVLPKTPIAANPPSARTRGKQRSPQEGKRSIILSTSPTSKQKETRVENMSSKGNMLVNVKVLVEFICKFPCPVCLTRDKWNCHNETNPTTGVSQFKFRCRGCTHELVLSESEVVPDGIGTEISKNMLEIVARAVVGGLSKTLTDKLLATLQLPAMGIDLWTRCAKICQATFSIPADHLGGKDNITDSKSSSESPCKKAKESEPTQNKHSIFSSESNITRNSNEQHEDDASASIPQREVIPDVNHQKIPDVNPQKKDDSNVIPKTGIITKQYQNPNIPLTSQKTSKKNIEGQKKPTKCNSSTNFGHQTHSGKNIEKQLIIQSVSKYSVNKENNNSHFEHPTDVDVVKEEVVDDREEENILKTVLEPLEVAQFIVKEEKDSDLSSEKVAQECALKEDELFVCCECDYKCNSNTTLIIHMRTHNLSEDSDNIEKANIAFVCCECNNRFKDSMSLTKHMALHTDKKKFGCTKCNYTCSDKATLNKHEMKHNEEKPFECTDCDYRTKYKSDLRVHMRGHTGEKPFVCSICQYSCIAASCLKQHMKSKHNKDPYECTECHFTSMFCSNLKLHMKSHTGDKKFICTKCGYKSSTNSELKMHSRTHFVEKRFECTDCEYKSASKATMKVHMLTHQNKKSKQAGKHWQEDNSTIYSKSNTDYKKAVDKSNYISDKVKMTTMKKKLSVKRKVDKSVPSSDFQSIYNETRNSKKKKIDNFPSISSELSIELVDIKKKINMAKNIEDTGTTSSGWNFNENFEILKKTEMPTHLKKSETSPITVVKRKVGRPKKNYDNAISITPVINQPHSIFSSESIDKEIEARTFSDAIYIESVNICNAAAKSKRVRNVSSASSSENDSSKSKKVCKMYECAYCDFKAKKKSDFKQHVSTHSAENVDTNENTSNIKGGSSFTFTCHKCALECSTDDELNAHMSSHASYKFTELENQGPEFEAPNYSIKETESVEYWCPECEYKCTNILDLAEHTKGHDDSYIEEYPHKCLICTRRFKEKRQAKIHMRREHTRISADRRRIFVCSECEYSCQQSGSLKTHMRKHTGEKPFMCRFCPYRCTTKSSLTVHNRTHTGEKPYACTLCDFRSTNNSDLKVHIRNHTGEKPYVCTECPYACKTSSSLKTHLRIHKGEKPFECPMCNYKCTTSSTLRMHIRTHTGEKPFHCQECGYRCTSGSTLKKHKEIHWRERRLNYLIHKTHTI